MRKLSESVIVKRVAELCAERITRKTIRDLQQLHDTLSGQGSGLTSAWDEICVQVQRELSVSWEAYVLTVQSLVEAYVEELPDHEKEALWLQTDEGQEWNCKNYDERESCPVCDHDIVTYLIKQYIFPAAECWTNHRIRNYLDLY